METRFPCVQLLGILKGTKESRSYLPVGRVGAGLCPLILLYWPWEMDVSPWLRTWEAFSFALRGLGGKRNRRPYCLREAHHYSFATNYFGVIFSLKEFFAKTMSEQLIHYFSASVLFSLLKKVRRLFRLNFPLLRAKVRHFIQELQISPSQAQWLRNTWDQLPAALNFGYLFN